MLPISTTLRAGVAVAAALAIAACTTEAHDDHHDDEGGHAHTAKYGGVLVELGDHFASIEVVQDHEAGTLKVYCLDAHAEESERSPTESLSMSLDVHADEPIVVTLAPHVSELSGETVGDSSLFEVTDDVLKGVDHFHGTIAEITLRGTKFEDVKFDWPPEDDHDEDGHDEDGDAGHDEDEHEEGDGHDDDGDH